MEDVIEEMAKCYKEKGAPIDIGYVYILKADNGLYKIGKSHNPKSRIQSIQTATPGKLEVYALFRSINCTRAESVLHDCFENFRENGEWFRLSQEHLDHISERSIDDDHFLVRCYL